MKQLLFLLAVIVCSAPAASLADTKSDSNTAPAVTLAETKLDSDGKVDSNAKLDFNAKCAKCHRENKALPKMAKSLGVDPRKLTLRTSKMNGDEMISIIEKGKDKMPGFEKQLTKGQIADLVNYILYLKSRNRPSRGWYGPAAP